MSSLGMKERLGILVVAGVAGYHGAQATTPVNASELNQSGECNITYRMPPPINEQFQPTFFVEDARGRLHPLDNGNPTEAPRTSVTVSANRVDANRGQNKILDGRTGYQNPDMGPIPCGSDVVISPKVATQPVRLPDWAGCLIPIAVIGGAVVGIRALSARRNRRPEEVEAQRREDQADTQAGRPRRRRAGVASWWPWYQPAYVENQTVVDQIDDRSQSSVPLHGGPASGVDTIMGTDISEDQNDAGDPYPETVPEMISGVDNEAGPPPSDDDSN